MFPLGDDNPTRHLPVMTWLIIALNVSVFVMFNLQMSEADLHQWSLQWGYDVERPFARQIFTSMFMHGGFAHILGNMWVLWIVGDNVEDKLGKFRFLALYLVGGCAAALTFAGIDHGTEIAPELLARLGGRRPPLVGASGAIAAIMGVYLVFFPEARIRLLFWWLFFVRIIPVRAKWFIGLTLALDLFTSVSAHGASVGGVATMAHVGGGVFGILAALALKSSVGGGGEGDAWDVHTGFAKRMRAGAEPWHDERLPPAPFMAPEESDESSIRDVERSITQLVRGGRVRDAIDVYPAYVAMSREQPLPDDVQIEIAHEFYRQWLPREAIPAYLRYLDTHPRGDDVAEAKFRLGVLFARGLSRRDEAAKWLREAAAEHHDAQIRAAAAQMLAQLGG
jgi:membrane associated rhomboid family serine protease